MSHPHTNRSRLPIATMLDYMSSNKEFYKKLRDLDSDDSANVKETIEKDLEKVKTIVTSTVWDPLKKYASVIISCIACLLLIWIIIKLCRCLRANFYNTGSDRRQRMDEEGQRIEVIRLRATPTATEST